MRYPLIDGSFYCGSVPKVGVDAFGGGVSVPIRVAQHYETERIRILICVTLSINAIIVL